MTPHLDVRTLRTATKTTYVPGVMPADKVRGAASRFARPARRTYPAFRPRVPGWHACQPRARPPRPQSARPLHARARPQGRSLALHWIVKAAEARKKASRGSFAECLALELLMAYQKRGPARQKRDDLHKLALQNRANLHLRWW